MLVAMGFLLFACGVFVGSRYGAEWQPLNVYDHVGSWLVRAGAVFIVAGVSIKIAEIMS